MQKNTAKGDFDQSLECKAGPNIHTQTNKESIQNSPRLKAKILDVMVKFTGRTFGLPFRSHG